MSLNLNFGTKHPVLISVLLASDAASQCQESMPDRIRMLSGWSNNALLGSLYPETMLSLKVFPSKCPVDQFSRQPQESTDICHGGANDNTKFAWHFQPGRKKTQPHWMTMNNKDGHIKNNLWTQIIKPTKARHLYELRLHRIMNQSVVDMAQNYEAPNMEALVLKTYQLTVAP
jgi:hypothetical protein